MRGAAPHLCRLLVCAVTAFGFAGASVAHARTDYAHDQQTKSDLWGLGVDSHNLRLLDDGLARQLRDAGVNVMLVDKRGLSRGQRAEIDQLAPRFGFRKITLPRKLTRSTRAGKAFCASAKRRHPGGTCTLRTASLRTAGQLASSRNVDLVVVRLKGLPALTSLRIHGKHAKVMVMVEIGQHRSVDTTAWSAAIRQVAGEQGVDLAVAPRGTQGTTALASYATVLSSNGATPLSSPASLSLQSATASSLKVRWQRPNGYKVTGYEAFVNGALKASVKTTSATLDGLACGTAYTIAVDALKGASRSATATLTASTSACTLALAPSSPTGVTATGATSSSVSLAWAPSLTGSTRVFSDSEPLRQPPTPSTVCPVERRTRLESMLTTRAVSAQRSPS